MSVPPVDRLDLIKGSTIPFEIVVLDGDGNPESLSGADKASLTVRDKAGGTVILQRDTVAGGLSIDVATGKLLGTMTQVVADGLTVGYFIAASAVHYTAGDRWIDSDEINVRIRLGIAAHP